MAIGLGALAFVIQEDNRRRALEAQYYVFHNGSYVVYNHPPPPPPVESKTPSPSVDSRTLPPPKESKALPSPVESKALPSPVESTTLQVATPGSFAVATRHTESACALLHIGLKFHFHSVLDSEREGIIIILIQEPRRAIGRICQLLEAIVKQDLAGVANPNNPYVCDDQAVNRLVDTAVEQSERALWKKSVEWEELADRHPGLEGSSVRGISQEYAAFFEKKCWNIAKKLASLVVDKIEKIV